MSEMAPISGATRALTGVRPGSVGKARARQRRANRWTWRPGLRVLSPGEKGELRVRGPHMMTGYSNRPEETAQTIRDGFIYTGDIGHLDEDGFVFITDRKKDVVFVKGFQRLSRARSEEGAPRSPQGRHGRASVGRAGKAAHLAVSGWSPSSCPALAKSSMRPRSPRYLRFHG